MASVTVERPSAAASPRMLSLDVLRGITIAFMIMVNNNGGHAYWPFEHSAWNGWTPTDLVFPTFLFLVGVTTVMSIESRIRRGNSPASQVPHILRRFVLLFLLGIFVNGFPKFPWEHLRIYGVLQRIALCYLLAGLLWLAVRSSQRKVATLTAILAACLLGYWILMRFVPVPGYGVPGRDIPLLDKDANLVAWLDRHIFPGRLYEGTRDPEGLLSDIPSLATAILGMLTAVWLRTTRSLQSKCAGLLAAGILCILLGELWNPWFPINKKLWTSSYVLFAAGCSLVLWALCMFLSDIKGWKQGWTGFWLVFGMNAIFAYVLSEVLSSLLWTITVRSSAGPPINLGGWIYAHVFQSIQPSGVASLIYSICFMLVCWLPTAVLYRRKIFLKL
ncbi:MAG TPA: heparan-alpha-glucosaminide N-acetyltransferase domain-containing protein [Acidobacteriaceae bacterium]|jgi:predicted acyltransferase|nr:heparan-alpha-glucosaminide N-acetyltransferase domain-containing protein [Acidobacteriaceae bacterium]